MGNIGVHLILFSLLLHFQPALIGILCLFSLRSDALLQCEEPLPAVCKWPPAGSGQEAALGAGEWGPGGACPVSGELGWPHAALTLPCVWLRQGSPAPRTAPGTEYRSQETAKGRKEWMKSTHLLLGKNRHYSEGGNLWGCRVREKNGLKSATHDSLTFYKWLTCLGQELLGYLSHEVYLLKNVINLNFVVFFHCDKTDVMQIFNVSYFLCTFQWHQCTHIVKYPSPLFIPELFHRPKLKLSIYQIVTPSIPFPHHG